MERKEGRWKKKGTKSKGYERKIGDKKRKHLMCLQKFPAISILKN